MTDTLLWVTLSAADTELLFCTLTFHPGAYAKEKLGSSTVLEVQARKPMLSETPLGDPEILVYLARHYSFMGDGEAAQNFCAMRLTQASCALRRRWILIPG